MVKRQYLEIAKSDVFWHFLFILHIPCLTEAGQVRLTFICIKTHYVPDRSQVISPTEVEGAYWFWCGTLAAVSE